jgi:purine nucleosidase
MVAQGADIESIIIDCDPGVDDAVAIFLAIASPELRLLGVTTVCGNRSLAHTTRNARRLLEIAERREIPVHAGCAVPILNVTPKEGGKSVHGEDGVGMVPLPEPVAPAGAAHGVDYIIDTLRREPSGTVTLVLIGPLTNIAMAVVKAPDIVSRIKRIAVMGGAAFCPGNVTPVAEFNFWFDPAAANVVMALRIPIVMFGLDVTQKVLADDDRRKRLHTINTRCGQAAAQMIEAYAKGDSAIHDACTIAYLVDPRLFEGRHCRINVDYRPGSSSGHSVAKPESAHELEDGPGSVLVMLEASQSGIFRLLESRLATLP